MHLSGTVVKPKNSVMLAFFLFLSAVISLPVTGFVLPRSVEEAKNFRLPNSVRRPNFGLSIADTISLSVDKDTGEVNLAGGVSHGFGLDAGVLNKGFGDSVSFSSGLGQSFGSATGFGKANEGAFGLAKMNSWVPSVKGDGLGFSHSNSLAKGMGSFGKGSGSAVSQIS